MSRLIASLYTALALTTLPACDACSPQGWWWADPNGIHGSSADADPQIGEGEAAEGEGDPSEGEGDASEGEGDVDEGEGEGDASEGEGEGEGEGDGSGNLWVQIDYSSAFTPSSPSFTFSNTPGFTGAAWAADGATYPEAWDRFNNMAVVNDPIGTSLELDGELQLMLGLHTLQSYTRAVVRLEGRARETSSSATFDVYNPLNNCGVSGVTFSNDWTVHTVDVDLGSCLLPGQGVQAVRVAPTNGVVALVRMRVILEGAVY